MSEHVPFIENMLYNGIVNEKFGIIFFRHWRKLIRQREKTDCVDRSISAQRFYMFAPALQSVRICSENILQKHY